MSTPKKASKASASKKAPAEDDGARPAARGHELELSNIKQVRKVLRANNPWLAADDIEDELTVTIARYVEHPNAQMEDGERTVVALHFVEHEKALVLNATNADVLEERFGRDIADHKGQEITLYAARLDRPVFGRKYGVRIK